MKKSIAMLCLAALMLSMLSACGMNSVKKVEKAIDAIGEVNLDSESVIQAAKELYLALDNEKQEKVSNRNKLEYAENALQDMKIRHVEDLIDQINTDNKESIDAARSAFDALDESMQIQVQNVNALKQVEEMYEMLLHISDYMITNYQPIGTSKVSLFDESTEQWFSVDDAAATAYICFLLQGNNENSIDLDLMSFNVYICISREADRIDIYAKYGTDKTLGIQYWPTDSKARVGTIKTDIAVKDYVDILVAGDIVDAAREIPLESCSKVLNAMGG